MLVLHASPTKADVQSGRGEPPACASPQIFQDIREMSEATIWNDFGQFTKWCCVLIAFFEIPSCAFWIP